MRPNLTGTVRIASARDRKRMTRQLRQGLARLAELVDQPYVDAFRIQLVAQVCGARSFPAWRETRGALWRKQSSKYSTSTWPQTLPEDHLAAVLLPLPVGPVSTTAGDHPPLLATPLFTHGRPRPFDSYAPYYDGVLGLVTSWVSNPAFCVTALLAPPVVETIAFDRIAERTVESFGVEWPLPPPPGL